MLIAYISIALAGAGFGALLDTMVAGKTARGALIGALIGAFALWLGTSHLG